MYKIVYDKNTGNIITKKSVLFEEPLDWLEDNQTVLYLENKPKGWFIDLETKEIIEKPQAANVLNLTFNKPESISETPMFKAKEKQANQKELAVVRVIGIGDVIMTLPLLKSLREKLPDWYISYWTGKSSARVLLDNESLDSVNTLNYKTPTEGYPPIPEEVVGYDKSVNLINKFDFGSITWTRPRVDNIFLSANSQLVNVLKEPLETPTNFELPKLTLTDEQKRFALETFSINNLFGSKVVGCILSSHGDCRFWELSKWYELADSMLDYKFLWFSDNKIHSDIKSEKNIINTSNQLNFEEFLSLLYHCNLILTPDTSAMHLAEMMRIPCLVLEGSTNFSFHNKYYRHVESIKLKRPLECQPCYDWQLRSDCFKQDGLPWCLNRIKVKDVDKKLRGMF